MTIQIPNPVPIEKAHIWWNYVPDGGVCDVITVPVGRHHLRNEYLFDAGCVCASWPKGDASRDDMVFLTNSPERLLASWLYDGFADKQEADNAHIQLARAGYPFAVRLVKWWGQHRIDGVLREAAERHEWIIRNDGGIRTFDPGAAKFLDFIAARPLVK